MNPRRLVLLVFVGLSGCSDLGPEPWAGWTEYDLPYAQIYLPPELVRQQSVAAMPENPDFAGIVDNERVCVEFCIYTPLWESQFQEYQEVPITLGGKHAVLFQCRGFFHVYDSHISSMVGVKAYFSPDGSPVVVVIAVQSPGADDLARRILMSLHPQPMNTGMPL